MNLKKLILKFKKGGRIINFYICLSLEIKYIILLILN